MNLRDDLRMFVPQKAQDFAHLSSVLRERKVRVQGLGGSPVNLFRKEKGYLLYY